MIKGWRNNPQWVALYEHRIAERASAKLMGRMAIAQEAAIAANNAHMEAEARHRAECHAQHEAEGTLTSQRKRETMN